MYQVQDSVALLRARRGFAAARKTGRPFVCSHGAAARPDQLLTDISSEMVSAVLPLYMVQVLGLNPLQIGVLNGIQQGGSAFARLIFGFVADRAEPLPRGRRHRLRPVGNLQARPAGDHRLRPTDGGAPHRPNRQGHPDRTARRDDLAQHPQDELGTAFGVHRAMDTCGAMLGPLLGFALLALTPHEYHGIFLISFCFALIGVAILLLLVDDPARDPERVKAAEAEAEAAVAAPAAPAAPAPTEADEPASGRLTLRGATRLLSGGPLGGLVIISFLLGLATIGDALLYLQLYERLDFADSLFPLLYVGTSSIFMVMAVPAGRLF